MNTILQISTIVALVGTAIMAGLFFVFSNTVMTALAKLPQDEGIRAMRSINRVIINPVFLVLFLGTAALSLVIGILAIMSMGTFGSHWLLMAACLYLFGTFFCTVAGNVPLNEKLERIGNIQAAEFWQLYLQKWTRYNHYRTVASVLAVVLYAVGLVQF